MTREQIEDDLAYAANLAADGAKTPLLGGPIGLLWGVLLTLVFAGQWAILSGLAGVSEQSLMYLWLAFAVIGGMGSFLLSQKIDRKAGANSAANRVESYVWTMFAGMMATLFAGVCLNIWLSDGTPELYDIMVIVGFAGQGTAYGVVAKMSGVRRIHMAALACFVASAICFAAFGDVKLYLMAAIGTVFTVILPSALSMSGERKTSELSRAA